MTTTERLPKETAKAFDAFLAYAKMGPQKRSLAAVGQALGKSTTLIEKWSSRHDWVKRAALWDNQQNHTEQSAAEQAEMKVALEKARRREQVQETAWESAKKLIEKAKEMINF